MGLSPNSNYSWTWVVHVRYVCISINDRICSEAHVYGRNGGRLASFINHYT